MTWGYGAAGSAFEWHSKGQGFESPYLHHKLPENLVFSGITRKAALNFDEKLFKFSAAFYFPLNVRHSAILALFHISFQTFSLNKV